MTNGVATAEGRGFGDNTMLLAAAGVLVVGAIGFTAYKMMQKKEEGDTFTNYGAPVTDKPASTAPPAVSGQAGSTQITTVNNPQTGGTSVIVANGGTQTLLPDLIKPGQSVGTTTPVQYPWSTMTTYAIPAIQTYSAATKTYVPYNTQIPVTVTEPGVSAGINTGYTGSVQVGQLTPLNRFTGDQDSITQCPGGNIQGGLTETMKYLLYGTTADAIAWRARFCS
jgi:hypothetical protein